MPDKKEEQSPAFEFLIHLRFSSKVLALFMTGPVGVVLYTFATGLMSG